MSLSFAVERIDDVTLDGPDDLLVWPYYSRNDRELKRATIRPTR